MTYFDPNKRHGQFHDWLPYQYYNHNSPLVNNILTFLNEMCSWQCEPTEADQNPTWQDPAKLLDDLWSGYQPNLNHQIDWTWRSKIFFPFPRTSADWIQSLVKNSWRTQCRSEKSNGFAVAYGKINIKANKREGIWKKKLPLIERRNEELSTKFSNYREKVRDAEALW